MRLINDASGSRRMIDVHAFPSIILYMGRLIAKISHLSPVHRRACY